jgi:cell division protein ZipA
MEVTTIIGIVVAVIICLVGLRMMLRKPSDAAPSLDSELHINAESHQPIIPRHVRDQLQSESEAASLEKASTERVEPSLSAVTSDPVVDEVSKTNTDENSNVVESLSEQDEPLKDTTSSEVPSEVKTEESAEPAKKVEPDFVLNPNVETAEIEEFEEESSILDVHLHEQQRYDDQSALANAEHIISLNVYPNPRKALSGDKTLKVLLKYGLRFGEMNCFHRYETPEEESQLMFSVLRITDEGPAGFDLETLSVEQVQGLAFFLALPHPNVQKGYDSMVSIAGLIARETDGTVYDENNLEFTPQLKEHWRHKAIDYRSGQAV